LTDKQGLHKQSLEQVEVEVYGLMEHIMLAVVEVEK
jgi:hypothetical protein